MNPCPPPADSPLSSSRRPRHRRWLWSAGLLLLAPKCVACLLAYAGIGAVLGLGGPELCSAPDTALHSWWLWASLPLAILLSIGIVRRWRLRDPE